MLDIKVPIKQIENTITSLREKKGEEKKTLNLIDKALDAAHDFVVELMLEKHIVYQHEVMKEKANVRGKRNRIRVKKYTDLMEKVANEAMDYAEKNNLDRWVSRVQARLGRASDYKGEYRKSTVYYKRAIETSGKDPEQKYEGIPRWLEYEGFLAYSILMSGRVKKGLSLAREAYEKYDLSVGKRLKKVDYPTWAIWKSGVPVRMVQGLIESRADFNNKEILNWLAEVVKILEIPKESNRWLGKVDFQFRKDEIAAIRRKLRD